MQTGIRPNAKLSLPPQFVKGGIYQRYIKRPMDFVLSLLAIIVLSPILLAVALLVRIKLGRPVLFKQERPGLNEKIFTLYKFRTMTNEKDANGKLLPDSVRLTSFGKFLRSTSLDELPELFNILKGDMSIVGPRPLLPSYLPFYTKTEKLRHSIRPGLTGLAQISGRNYLHWDERLATDVEYVSKVSFKIDLLIVLKTIEKVLEKDGISVNFIGDLDDIRKKK